MTRRRKAFVYLVLAGIVLGHLVCIVARKSPYPELYPWPFSNYRMYSSAANDSTTFSRWELVGVTVDDREILLPEKSLPRSASISSGLNRGIRRIGEDPEGVARFERLVGGFGGMYENLREAGIVEGESIEAVRLYRRNWEREGGRVRAWREREREMVLHVPLDASANYAMEAAVWGVEPKFASQGDAGGGE